MKNQNTNLDRLPIYSKLVKEGFTLATLLKCNDHQLLTLHSKILNEVEEVESTTSTYDFGVDSDVTKFEEDVVSDVIDHNSTLEIDVADKKATVTAQNEEMELTKDNKTCCTYRKRRYPTTNFRIR